MARRTPPSSTLIAGRRLGDDPRRAFRAISGLVQAVFVGTVFIGVIGTVIAKGNGFGTMTLPEGTVVQPFDREGGRALLAPAQAQTLSAKLRGQVGVRAIVPVYAPDGQAGPGDPRGLVAASDWARLRVYGRARTAQGGPASGGDAVSVSTDDLLVGALGGTSWRADPLRAGPIAGLPVQAVLVTTDGRELSVERVRTALELAVPGAGTTPKSAGQLSVAARSPVTTLQHMVDVGIILSLVLAGCSLAVSVAGGLIERKRPFTLLRLTGMPLSHLRRVVVLEAAVPLVLVALVSAAAGFVAAELILRATPNGFGVSPPAMSYYVIMASGLVAALGVVCATLPFLDRVTQLPSAQTE